MVIQDKVISGTTIKRAPFFYEPFFLIVVPNSIFSIFQPCLSHDGCINKVSERELEDFMSAAN